MGFGIFGTGKDKYYSARERRRKRRKDSDRDREKEKVKRKKGKGKMKKKKKRRKRRKRKKCTPPVFTAWRRSGKTVKNGKTLTNSSRSGDWTGKEKLCYGAGSVWVMRDREWSPN